MRVQIVVTGPKTQVGPARAHHQAKKRLRQ